MISLRYKNAYKEVLEIIKYLPPKEVYKIPKEKIEYLKRNTPVLMLNYNEGNSGWSKVKVNGREGYVSNDYLTPVNTKIDTYQVPNQPGGEQTQPKPPVPSVKGDADGDGQITASDYVLIKNHIMEFNFLTEEQKTRADYDGDGEITASDYMLIKNEIMK